MQLVLGARYPNYEHVYDINAADLKKSGATEEEFKETAEKIAATPAYKLGSRRRLAQRAMIAAAAIQGSGASVSDAAAISLGMLSYHRVKENKNLKDNATMRWQL